LPGSRRASRYPRLSSSIATPDACESVRRRTGCLESGTSGTVRGEGGNVLTYSDNSSRPRTQPLNNSNPSRSRRLCAARDADDFSARAQHYIHRTLTSARKRQRRPSYAAPLPCRWASTDVDS
jgi:hypothetical protein